MAQVVYILQYMTGEPINAYNTEELAKRAYDEWCSNREEIDEYWSRQDMESYHYEYDDSIHIVPVTLLD